MNFSFIKKNNFVYHRNLYCRGSMVGTIETENNFDIYIDSPIDFCRLRGNLKPIKNKIGNWNFIILYNPDIYNFDNWNDNIFNIGSNRYMIERKYYGDNPTCFQKGYYDWYGPLMQIFLLSTMISLILIGITLILLHDEDFLPDIGLYVFLLVLGIISLIGYILFWRIHLIRIKTKIDTINLKEENYF